MQVYAAPPQGKLGKPLRNLAAFGKTKLLSPGETETLEFRLNPADFASFDDSGVTGHKSAYVLEPGEYVLYVGGDVRRARQAGVWRLDALRVTKQLTAQAAPTADFSRMKPQETASGLVPVYEPVPRRETSRKADILAHLPEATPFTGDRGIGFADVCDGSASLDDFAAQLDIRELDAITRGEGLMDSPLGPAGNAGVLGGTTASLREKGVPTITTTDGPSGIRLACYASLLPCGTALASSWNPALVEKLGVRFGREMAERGSDILLGPGLNIHRDPLCGRNFEYYSEDPYVSGVMAAAMVRGIQSNPGRSACPKHFACNNQEWMRNQTDSRVSERALREIYLRGFELCVARAKPLTLMTSYNKVNGVWAHYHYDLVTNILRGEWGYDGLVITDWWMQPAVDPDFPDVSNNAYRVRAQVDVLMPGIMEHIERAGIHSGDSACSIPPVTLAKKYLDKIEEQAAAIARDFRVKGILNVQFAVCEDQVWIIEANPRASRTVPVVSKVTGMPLARIATYLMLGHSLSEYKDILKPHPEMRATGEVMGLAPTFGMAYFKAQQAAGSRLPLKGTVLVSVSERERKYLLPIVKTLHELGFKLVATEGTAKFLAENGIPHSEVKKLNEGRPNVADLIKNREVALIINTPIGRLGKIDDSCIRMLAIQYKIPYMTTIAAAKASAAGIREALHGDSSPKSLQEYQAGR